MEELVYLTWGMEFGLQGMCVGRCCDHWSLGPIENRGGKCGDVCREPRDKPTKTSRMTGTRMMQLGNSGQWPDKYSTGVFHGLFVWDHS